MNLRLDARILGMLASVLAAFLLAPLALAAFLGEPVRPWLLFLLPPLAVAAAGMLAGRQELYTVLLVFLPGFWRR